MESNEGSEDLMIPTCTGKGIVTSTGIEKRRQKRPLPRSSADDSRDDADELKGKLADRSSSFGDTLLRGGAVADSADSMEEKKKTFLLQLFQAAMQQLKRGQLQNWILDLPYLAAISATVPLEPESDTEDDYLSVEKEELLATNADVAASESAPNTGVGSLSVEKEELLAGIQDVAKQRQMRSLMEQEQRQMEQMEQRLRQMEQMEQRLRQMDQRRRLEQRQMDQSWRLEQRQLTYINQVQMKTVEVETQLLSLAGLNQAEASVASASKNTPSKQARLESRPFLVAEAYSLYASVVSNPTPINALKNKLSRITEPQGNKKAESRLTVLVAYLETYFSKARILRNGDDYGMVPESINKLKEKIRIGMRDGTLKLEDLEQEEMVAPGPAAHEKDGTQPFLQALLQLVGECFESSDSEGSSPFKTYPRKEPQIPPTEYRRKRFVHCMLRKEGNWEGVVFDDTIMIPLEVKPGWRQNRNMMGLLREATDQVLSHLAKHLFIGFNFAGIGVPCHATGLVANMAALRILHLRYENVGTPGAKLTLYQSDLLPLMTSANFDRWIEENPQQRLTLREELYGENVEGSMDRNGVPKGIRVLFNLMQCPSDDLRGFSISSESDELGDSLGSGTTAVVFRRKTADKKVNGVVKVSRYGLKTDVEHELRILKELARNTKNEHIPEIVQLGDKTNTIEVKFGSVVAKLPAIRTRPEGKQASLVFACSTTVECEEGMLGAVLEGLGSALKHMHARKIFHLDVSPKNVVIADERAVLIDYSLAQHGEQDFRGFMGTPNYAHRKIFDHHLHNRRAWKPHAGCDFAGLGFTLAFFAGGSVCAWNVDGYPMTRSQPDEDDIKELNATMDKRVEKAKDVIQKRVKDDRLRTRIMDLLE